MNLDADKIKETVRQAYGAIAEHSGGSDCGCGCTCGPDVLVEAGSSTFREKYDGLAGYEPAADLGLGCGIPTEHARITEGETVLDLGSGAGNDAFVARAIVGSSGKVIGVDMTSEMIDLARSNAERLGHENVEFHLGEIENLPVDDGTVDVVVSNCVLNLVPDKEKAFGEIERVLRRGGRFCVSDIVIDGDLPDHVRESAVLYAGCVAGAIRREEYLAAIDTAKLASVEVPAEREIVLTDEMLAAHLPAETIAAWRKSGARILSITVTGQRPE